MALTPHSPSRSHSNVHQPGTSTLSLGSRSVPSSKFDIRLELSSSSNAEDIHFDGPSPAWAGRANRENPTPGVMISQVSRVVVDMDDDEHDVATSLGMEQYVEEEAGIPYSPPPFSEDENKEGGESHNVDGDAKGNRNEGRELESSGLESERGTEEESYSRVRARRERSVMKVVGGARSQPVVDTWEMLQLPSRPRGTMKVPSAEQQKSGTVEDRYGGRSGGWSKTPLVAPWDEPTMEMPMHPLIMNYVSWIWPLGIFGLLKDISLFQLCPFPISVISHRSVYTFPSLLRMLTLVVDFFFGVCRYGP